MRRFLLSLAAITALSGVWHGAPALAAPNKVWVSNAGGDGNPCNQASPCATFQHAHDVVAAGGEISVFNAGDYGPVNITKAVSISNDGAGEAGILNTNGASAAITISAGRGDVVSLRGLVLDGAVQGADGIDVNAVGALHLQNCVIRNFEGSFGARGLIATANTGNNMALYISDTIIFNNGASANSGGIQLFSQGGSINAVLNRVQLENNVIGLRVSSSSGINQSPGAPARVTVRDSTVVGNASDGIFVTTGFGGFGEFLTVERSTVVNNSGAGLHADGVHAVIIMKDTTITKNGTGVSATSGGQILSFGNNMNFGNLGAEGAATGFVQPF